MATQKNNYPDVQHEGISFQPAATVGKSEDDFVKQNIESHFTRYDKSIRETRLREAYKKCQDVINAAGPKPQAEDKKQSKK